VSVAPVGCAYLEEARRLAADFQFNFLHVHFIFARGQSINISSKCKGLCEEGHEFLRLCKKRNKAATLHLLDVLVTQHAKWTAKRIRRGLFGQALVDFSTESWSSIQLKDSARSSASQQTRTQPKKTPRLLRSFVQSRVVSEKKGKAQSLVPGMSQYSDDTETIHNKKVFPESDNVSVASGQGESEEDVF
jgi:hypothetical protein